MSAHDWPTIEDQAILQRTVCAHPLARAHALYAHFVDQAVFACPPEKGPNRHQIMATIGMSPEEWREVWRG